MIETSPILPVAEVENSPEMVKDAAFWEALGPDQLALSEAAHQLYEQGTAQEIDQHG